MVNVLALQDDFFAFFKVIWYSFIDTFNFITKLFSSENKLIIAILVSVLFSLFLSVFLHFLRRVF